MSPTPGLVLPVNFAPNKMVQPKQVIFSWCHFSCILQSLLGDDAISSTEFGCIVGCANKGFIAIWLTL